MKFISLLTCIFDSFSYIKEIPEEFGKELQIKLTTIMEECLKPERPRVSMEDALKVLHNPVVSHKNKVELFCIGTGQGTTGTNLTIQKFACFS